MEKYRIWKIRMFFCEQVRAATGLLMARGTSSFAPSTSISPPKVGGRACGIMRNVIFRSARPPVSMVVIDYEREGEGEIEKFEFGAATFGEGSDHYSQPSASDAL